MATAEPKKKLVALQIVQVYREGEVETLKCVDIPVRDQNRADIQLDCDGINSDHDLDRKTSILRSYLEREKSVRTDLEKENKRLKKAIKKVEKELSKLKKA